MFISHLQSHLLSLTPFSTAALSLYLCLSVSLSLSFSPSPCICCLLCHSHAHGHTHRHLHSHTLTISLTVSAPQALVFLLLLSYSAPGLLFFIFFSASLLYSLLMHIHGALLFLQYHVPERQGNNPSFCQRPISRQKAQVGHPMKPYSCAQPRVFSSAAGVHTRSPLVHTQSPGTYTRSTGVYTQLLGVCT